jgi:hypothetical protein
MEKLPYFFCLVIITRLNHIHKIKSMSRINGHSAYPEEGWCDKIRLGINVY